MGSRPGARRRVARNGRVSTGTRRHWSDPLRAGGLRDGFWTRVRAVGWVLGTELTRFEPRLFGGFTFALGVLVAVAHLAAVG